MTGEEEFQQYAAKFTEAEYIEQSVDALYGCAHGAYVRAGDMREELMKKLMDLCLRVDRLECSNTSDATETKSILPESDSRSIARAVDVIMKAWTMYTTHHSDGRYLDSCEEFGIAIAVFNSHADLAVLKRLAGEPT